MTPEEARQKAYDTTIASGEEKVAFFLKEQYANLQTLYPGLDRPAAGPEGDTEYRRMGKDLIDKRQFTSKSGVTVSLDDLNHKDDEYGLGLKGALGVDNLQRAVPTREQLHTVGNAVGSGVEEETGSIGFLGGATFVNALMGFLKWMFSGFEGGFDGLKSTIAQISAGTMSNAVGDNLEKLRASRPDMQTLITDETIADAKRNVRETVLEQGGQKVDKKPALRLEDVVPKTPEANQVQELQATIRQNVLTPEGSTPLAVQIADKYSAAVNEKKANAGIFATLGSAVGLVKIPSQDEINASSRSMATVIADTVSKTVTDPNFRTAEGRSLASLSGDKQAYSTAVTKEVGKALSTHWKEFDIPIKLDEKTKSGKTYLEMFSDEIQSGIAANQEKLGLVSRMAMNASMEKNPALASTRGSGSPVIGQPQDAQTVVANGGSTPGKPPKGRS